MPFSFIFFGVILIILNFSEDIKLKQKIFFSVALLFLLFSYFINIKIKLEHFSVNLFPFIIFIFFIVYFRILLKSVNKKKLYVLPILYAIIYLIVVNINIKFNYEFNYIYIAILISIFNIFNFSNLKNLIFGISVIYLFLEIANGYFFVMEFEYANLFTLSFLNSFSFSLCLDIIIYYAYKILNKYSKKQKRKLNL